MTTLKVVLDPETYHALLSDAGRHIRPCDWHLKVLLRQALGLPVPYPVETASIGEDKEVVSVGR